MLGGNRFRKGVIVHHGGVDRKSGGAAQGAFLHNDFLDDIAAAALAEPVVQRGCLAGTVEREQVLADKLLGERALVHEANAIHSGNRRRIKTGGLGCVFFTAVLNTVCQKLGSVIDKPDLEI